MAIETISVIVPVYNSSATLNELVDRVDRVLRALSFGYEVILVNDCSKDTSWEVIQRLAEARRQVRGINLMRNFGQHNAVLCGIRAARGTIIVTIDDDLQHPPEEIPKLLEQIEAGSDVVYGVPCKQRHSFWRSFASKFMKWVMQSATGIPRAVEFSAMRAFRTSLRDAFSGYRSPFVAIDVLLSWATLRFTHVLVQHDPRKAGRSNYTIRMLVRQTINTFCGFTVVPLQLASLAGFLFAGFGLVLMAYVVAAYFAAGGSVPGFPFLASIISILSGVQLFAMGVFGEYLARIHFRTLNKPPYVIREQAENETAHNPSGLL